MGRFQHRKSILVEKYGLTQQAWRLDQEAEASQCEPLPRSKGSYQNTAQPASSDSVLMRRHLPILTNNTANFGPSVSTPEKVENISFKPAHHSLHIIGKLCFHKLMHTRNLFKLLRKENCSKSTDHTPLKKRYQIFERAKNLVSFDNSLMHYILS